MKYNGNREREIKNLKKAGKKLACQNLFIITKEKPNTFIEKKDFIFGQPNKLILYVNRRLSININQFFRMSSI